MPQNDLPSEFEFNAVSDNIHEVRNNIHNTSNPDFKTDEEKKEEVCIHTILTTR